MKAFTKHTGKVVAMDRANVDTDQIIPKQFLKRIERTGLRRVFVLGLGSRRGGKCHPEFRTESAGSQGRERAVGAASTLVAAPAASMRLGHWRTGAFASIVAPSFADIFYNNCFKNGMLPIVLSEAQVDDLFQRAAKYNRYELTADLETQTLTDDHGLELKFEVE